MGVVEKATEGEKDGAEVEGRMGRGWKRLTSDSPSLTLGAVSNAGEGRLELTPSYFRMEELAGVFLPFVSRLGRVET